MSTFLQPAPQRAVPPGSLPSSKQRYLITREFDAYVLLHLLINCGYNFRNAIFP